MDHIEVGQRTHKPLRDLRVLDLTRVLAGPYCTMILGDLGADVIKVEGPDHQDSMRGIAPYYEGGESHYFMALNRNKRSVVVDLKNDEGRELFLKLVETCDIVVENFRNGVMDRLGLGFEALRAHNPSVIVCSISGYGQDNSWSHKPALDIIAQAQSGVMRLTGEPDGPPLKLGLPIGDLGAGLWSAVAILAALEGQRAGSDAQHIDISMLDGMLGMLGYLGQLALLTGESPAGAGNGHHNIVPYGCFRSKDGHLALGLLLDRSWERFCHATDRPDLMRDERFTTADRRRKNRQVVDEVVQAILLTRTTEEWMVRFDEFDVPNSPILDVKEALEQPPVVERQLVRSLHHPDVGQVDYVASPVRFTSDDLQRPLHPPKFGEHTSQVLSQRLGLTEEEIEDLEARNIIHRTIAEGETMKGGSDGSSRDHG